MPTVVHEKWDSGLGEDGESPSREKTYLIFGTDDPDDALTALETEAPETLGTLKRKRYRIESRLGLDQWVGSASYGKFAKNPPKEVGQSSYSFEITAQTQKITQSKQTIASYAPPGKTAPNFKGAIGVTRDGVEGCDVYFPQFSFSETHIVASAAVDDAYKALLYNLVGKTNNATFKNLPTDEVLLLGVTGSSRSPEDSELKFSFAASPGFTGLTIGDITGVDKPGWAYLWIRYEDEEDTTSHSIVKRPVAVYIERVYDNGDFADLGIGV